METRRSDCWNRTETKCVYWIMLGILVVIHLGQASQITITENGYSGIVVAFAPHVSQAEGEELIPQIKELFTNASNALYIATRHMAYFKDVTILVPKTWPSKHEYKMAGSETFGTADIRIDDPNPQYGDGPYTIQPLGCGSPGMYIHLTLKYLQNLNSTSTEYFGDPGKTIVHEWAHLRYGIFDEFGYPGDPMFPMFYYEGDRLLPNSCTNGKANGVYRDAVTGGSCDYAQDGLPNKDCVFQPDVDRNDHVTSSIASYHFLRNVETFCDDSSTHTHNPLAPNKHNVLCEGNSTWSVILQHEDFKNGSNPPNENVNLNPRFKFVHEQNTTFALLLDTSGDDSVSNEILKRRFRFLEASVTRWLKDDLPLGTQLGVLKYPWHVNFNYPFGVIDSDVTRENAIKEIRTDKPLGPAFTGKALEKAVKELNNYRNGSGGVIILVTDGPQHKTSKPLIEDVIPELVKNQVRLIAICLHTFGDISLAEAVQATRGKMYYVPFGASIEDMRMALRESLTFQYTEDELPQKVHAENVVVNTPFEVRNFSIDATIGNDTIIDFLVNVGNGLDSVSIVGPDDFYSMIPASHGTVAPIKFPFLKEGTYQYNLTKFDNNQQLEVEVSVTSKARSTDVKPIVTRCWIQETATSTEEHPRFVILAEVRQGNKPVINAGVWATVDRPDNNSVILQLFDNGNGSPDVTRDDGIYSRHFTQMSDSAGRYAVNARVTDDGTAAIREVGFSGSRSMPVTQNFQTDQLINDTQTGAFERRVSGGSFHVAFNLSEDPMDIYPPSRVSDLRVTFISEDDSFVVFNWTAPGDDADHGSAASYDIRYSSNWTLLKVSFSSCELLNDSLQLHPLPAGTEETYNTSIPGISSRTTIYVALKAMDKANLTSQLSNIVDVSGNVYIFPPPITTSTTYLPTIGSSYIDVTANNLNDSIANSTTPTKLSEDYDDDDTVMIVVGICLVVLAIVLVVIGVVVYRKKNVRSLTVQ